MVLAFFVIIVNIIHYLIIYKSKLKEIEKDLETSFIYPLFLFLNSVIWTKYSLLFQDVPLFLINIVGLFVSSLLLIFCHKGTKKKRKLEIILFLSFIGLYIFLLFYFLDSFCADVFGYIGIFFLLLVFTCPFFNIKKNIERRDEFFYQKKIILSGFFSCCAWLFYGFTKNDNTIIIPNVFGVILELIHLFISFFPLVDRSNNSFEELKGIEV